MSKITRDFDNKSLYNELKGAIEGDKLYWVRNDAKIRACYTSQNYEEFRQVVAAAHLNPLDKADKSKKLSKWNQYAVGEKLE